MARRGHLDADGSGHLLTIGGRQVAGKRLKPSSRAKSLAERGLPSPALYELDSEQAAQGYREAMMKLRSSNRHAASVYVYDESEYRQMRMFTTDDGTAGFALKGDEIVSVYSYQDSPHSGCGAALMAAAIDQGGRRLDCFETRLPDIYASSGFVPVARIKWNDDYAPEGWDYQLYSRFNDGRPDVVFMAYDKEQIDGRYSRGEGILAGDYDEAEAHVRRFIDAHDGAE